MDPVSSALLEKAIDGLSLRYNFIAQNIANANTPGYAPARVTFEDNLRAAASQGAASIRNVQPTVTIESQSAQGVRLDLELAAASQTAMRYRALVDILGQQMALDQDVLTSGGR